MTIKDIYLQTNKDLTIYYKEEKKLLSLILTTLGFKPIAQNEYENNDTQFYLKAKYEEHLLTITLHYYPNKDSNFYSKIERVLDVKEVPLEKLEIAIYSEISILFGKILSGDFSRPEDKEIDENLISKWKETKSRYL